MSMTEEVPAHLQGNGRPVVEELTLTDLKVTGTIPAELDGRYLRNGANPITGMSPATVGTNARTAAYVHVTAEPSERFTTINFMMRLPIVAPYTAIMAVL